MLILAFTTSTDHGGLALLKYRAGRSEMVAEKSWSRNSLHSDVLVEAVEKVFHRSKVDLSDLKLIAVDKGPGSFTGCRVAVNVARAMAFTLDIPVFAVSSLDILAHGAVHSQKPALALVPASDKIFLTLLDAHKSLTYGRLYRFKLAESFGAEVCSEVKAWTTEELVRLITSAGAIDMGTSADRKTLGKDTTSGKFKISRVKIYGTLSKNVAAILAEAGAVFVKSKKLNAPQASILASMALGAIEKQDKSLFQLWSQVEPSYIRSPDAVEKMQN